jgi:hypothetical protein
MDNDEEKLRRLSETIARVHQNLKAGLYINEAAVSQGVVLPFLEALGWPVFDTQFVTPEYVVEGRRVDFALCDQHGHPRTFLEVKRVGQSDGGDRQLFEYAYHQGIQFAVLTDGQEWSFYLPGEEGNYEDRRVYKLDLLERDSKECTERLHRYLSYERVLSGEALQAARTDYRDIARTRFIEAALPRAWDALLSSQDSLLVELLADKVEDLCGYKPDLETCSRYLFGISQVPISRAAPSIASAPAPTRLRNNRTAQVGISEGEYGYSFESNSHLARSAREVMQDVLTLLAKRDVTFLERFVARKHGKKRRYVSRDRSALYPGKPHLSELHAVEFLPGWWLGTNYSKRGIRDIIELACEVAGIQFGEDLQINLG